MLTDKQFITKYRHSKKLLRLTSIKPVDKQLKIGKYKIGKNKSLKPYYCFWFACGIGWIDFLYGEEQNYTGFEKNNSKTKRVYLYEFKLKKDNNVLLVNNKTKLAKFQKKYANIENYVTEFKIKVSQIYNEMAFSCNCILNYLYGDLENNKVEIGGPITFGEIAYCLLNQTLVYMTVNDS